MPSASSADQPSADRLALLYRVSQAFNSSLDLDEVLKRVMDEVIAAVRAALGDEAFNIAWEEGKKMSEEEALAYAVE